jgi:hypothetical protein
MKTPYLEIQELSNNLVMQPIYSKSMLPELV